MKDLILGAHLFFARGGDVIDAITVGPEAKPDNAPETNWTQLPDCEQFEPQRSMTKTQRWSPSPGVFKPRVTITTQNQLVLNFGLQQWDSMMLAELLFGGKKPVAGVFEPNGDGDPLQGWLKIQAYDQNNDRIVTMDLWCSLSIASYQFQNGINPYTLVAQVLYSTLNSGLIENL